MILLDLVFAIVGGGLAAVISGGICGAIIGRKKIDLTLAGLMGMFYGALAGSGIAVPVILFLIIK